MLPVWAGMVGTASVAAFLWQTTPVFLPLMGGLLFVLGRALSTSVQLRAKTLDALFRLADVLDARDKYTHGHCLRVGQYAAQIATHLGISTDETYLVFLGGRLHDLGKCAIKNEVLLKPAPLDDEEFRHMSTHAHIGGNLVAGFSVFRDCARYVRAHHERWDGKGYPDKLVGEAIPLGARLIAVADAYDAMTTTRPYRTALPIAEAIRRLREGAGTQWDPRLVQAFLTILEEQAAAEAHAANDVLQQVVPLNGVEPTSTGPDDRGATPQNHGNENHLPPAFPYGKKRSFQAP